MCRPPYTFCDEHTSDVMQRLQTHIGMHPLVKHLCRVVQGRTASWGLTAGDGTPSQAMALSTSASPARGSGRRLGGSPAPKAAPPSRTPAAPGPPCTAGQGFEAVRSPLRWMLSCDRLKESPKTGVQQAAGAYPALGAAPTSRPPATRVAPACNQRLVMQCPCAPCSVRPYFCSCAVSHLNYRPFSPGRA